MDTGEWRRELLEWLTEHPPPDSPIDTTGVATGVVLSVTYAAAGEASDGGTPIWLHETSAALDGGVVPNFAREGMLRSHLRSVVAASGAADDDDD